MQALVLVSNARLPSHRAQSLQVVQAACAFARAGVATTLAHALRRRTPPVAGGGALFAYYGVPPGPRADLRAIPCSDWIDTVPRALQFLPARLQELTFSRHAARFVLRERREATVLSREIEAARALLRAGHERVFLELHRVPGGRARRAWLREVARCGHGILAISEGVRDDLSELGIDPGAVAVEHDAFEPARFQGVPGRAQARAQLGIAPDVALVAYTGGLLEWKGVDVLVDAARSVPEASFVIAGGMEADVERVRRHAQGLSNVRLDGFQAPGRVPLYLSAADVLAIPNRSAPAISARYTSPLKVFEAGAIGAAVVASDLPALRALLSHGQDAWLVPADEAQALAQGLRKLLSDGALRSRLGSALKARVREHTFDARAARILAWMASRG